jgi:hypothetical protein
MGNEKKEMPDQIPETPGIADKLIDAMIEVYSPLQADGVLELKSTQDIVEEMESVAEVDCWKIQTAMLSLGFSVQHTGTGFFWKMFRRF